MAISQQQRTELLTLLVGMFDAAPGFDVLDDLANGIENGNTIEMYAANLINSSEFTGIYSRALTAEEFATSFVANLLGDTVDADTLAEAEAFVAGRLNAGATRDTVIIEALTALSNVSEEDETWGAAAAQLANKVEVAEYFGTQSSFSGLTLAQMQAVLATVTNDDATVTAVKAAIDSGDLDGVGSEGTTFTLTAGTDAGSDFVGTAFNDVYEAYTVEASGGGLVDTLQNVDSLDGGEGTDTLDVTLNGGTTVTPTLRNIENVVLRSTADGAVLQLSGSTGVTSVTVDSSTGTSSVLSVGEATLTVSDQNSNVTFGGSDADDLSLTLTSVGTTTSTTVDLTDAEATSATFNLNGTGSLDADGAVDTTVSIAIDTATAAIESAVISSTGTNVIDLDADLVSITDLTVNGAGSVLVEGTATDLSALTDLTVSGSVSLDLSAETLAALETIDAGSATGNINAGTVDATLTSATFGSGDDTLTQSAALAADTAYDLGAGNDTYTVGAATDNDTAVVDGGEGEDTLAMTAAFAEIISADADIAAVYQNFETLEISTAMDNVGDDSDDAVDLGDFEGIVNATLAAGVATGGAATVSGVGADATVTVEGAIANDGTLTITLDDATGSADELTIALDKAAPTDDSDDTVDYTTVDTTFVAQGVETLNISGNTELADGDIDVNNYTVNLTADDLVTLNISGNSGVSFTATNAMDELATVDASSATANVTVNLDAVDTIGATITAGSGDDTLTGSDFADTIVGGEGDDTITGGAGADTLTGGEGNDVFVLALSTDSTLAKKDTITDFTANTVGNDTDGAVDDSGAAAAADRDGDVIDLSSSTKTTIEFLVVSNSSDAQTFIQNANDDTDASSVNAALDSSTGNLYIDMDDDGTVDSVILLSGVTTLDEAAFLLA